MPRHKAVALTVSVAAALVLAGCMTLEEMAPPVDGPMAQASMTGGHNMERLWRGREIYIGQCAKCHNVEPIGRYSASEWQKILPEMAEETKLTPEQAADVHTYVMTARAWITQQPSKGR